ncbi:MAG TPA: hypothetical protein VES02_07410 [Dermatophilaceae bacterium]|nr:hypothetical protein [Dermatophilaceae bacterium]
MLGVEPHDLGVCLKLEDGDVDRGPVVTIHGRPTASIVIVCLVMPMGLLGLAPARVADLL